MQTRLFPRLLKSAHRARNTVQVLVGVRNPDIFRLSTVDAAAQRPAAVGVGAVDPSAPAKETLPAKDLHVYRDPASRMHSSDHAARFFDNTHHLVAHCDSWHSVGDATVLDMEITGANTRQSYPDDGVPFVLQNG